MAWINASVGKIVKIGSVPFIWEVTWIVWSEFTLEWPNGILFVVTILVKV